MNIKFVSLCWAVVAVLVLAGVFISNQNPKPATKNRQEFAAMKHDFNDWMRSIIQDYQDFELQEYQKPAVVYSISVYTKDNSEEFQRIILENIEAMGIWHKAKQEINYDKYTTYLAYYCN